MVREFQVGRPDDASFYSGILVAAFSLAEALTGMHWGSLSDRIGRKPVLLLGCAGTMLSLLVVGFAPNYWVALIGRIIGGVLNGNIGVIQTMVGELVKRPEHERKFATLLFDDFKLVLTDLSSCLRCHAVCLVCWYYHWTRHRWHSCKARRRFSLLFLQRWPFWQIPFLAS